MQVKFSWYSYWLEECAPELSSLFCLTGGIYQFSLVFLLTGGILLNSLPYSIWLGECFLDIPVDWRNIAKLALVFIQSDWRNALSLVQYFSWLNEYLANKSNSNVCMFLIIWGCIIKNMQTLELLEFYFFRSFCKEIYRLLEICQW